MTRDLRSRDELRRTAQDAATELGQAPAEEAVAWAAHEFPTTLAVACSMADAVLPHLVSRHLPGVDVLFLDTGYHFAQTLDTRQAVAATMPVRVVDVRARSSVAEQDAASGPRLHDRDPGECCRLRKVEPLADALRGYEAWATGVRRDEAPSRAATPLVTFDERHGVVKLNPLAAWSLADLLDYADRNGVLVNPLVSQGFPSIGCGPCTRAVPSGQDPRSGRWAQSAKTECGIHL